MRDKVWTNLENAFKGGYTEILDWPAEMVAIDMVDYASDMEDVPIEDMIPHIISWQEEQKIKKAELGG